MKSLKKQNDALKDLANNFDMLNPEERMDFLVIQEGPITQDGLLSDDTYKILMNLWSRYSHRIINLEEEQERQAKKNFKLIKWLSVNAVGIMDDKEKRIFGRLNHMDEDSYLAYMGGENKDYINSLYNKYLPIIINRDNEMDRNEFKEQKTIDKIDTNEAMRNMSETNIDTIYIQTPVKTTTIIPVRKTSGSAGFDLSAAKGDYLAPGERMAIETDIRIAIPTGFVGMIKPRSGLAFKYGIDTLAGVIDADFRGEIKAMLINHGVERWNFEEGERICQLLIIPLHSALTLTLCDEIDDTERGEGGFGSTGSN